MSTRFANRGLSNTMTERAGTKRQERDKSHDKSIMIPSSYKADVKECVPSL